MLTGEGENIRSDADICGLRLSVPSGNPGTLLCLELVLVYFNVRNCLLQNFPDKKKKLFV